MTCFNIDNSLYKSFFCIYIFLETLLCSGVVYGWTSIVVIFKHEKFYEKFCSVLDTNSTLKQNWMKQERQNCDHQDLMLNLIFTVSAICKCAEFPIGVLIDKFGAKKARLVSGCLYAISCLGLGFIKVGYEDFLFRIFIGIVFGGAVQLISAYQMSNYIFSTKTKSILICILAGAFDLSSFVFLMFKVVYEAGIALNYIAFGYAIISFVMTFFGSLGLVPGKDKVARINNSIESDSCNQVSIYTNLFGYIQLGGILVTPIVGFLFHQSENKVDEKSPFLQHSNKRISEIRSCIKPIVVTIVLTLILCMLSLFSDLSLEIPCYVLYTIVRAFLYANNAAFIGVAFPASQYGTLFGLNVFVSSIFGFFQYALFKLTKNTLNGNPFWVNTILLILVTICLVHPLYLFCYCKPKKISSKKKHVDKKPLLKPEPITETSI
ncbi:equilibrative nucleobase transporter 1 isoform X2 [Hydra vulgaris]|uniref:equilibrative nucleobase transporter 1 isoform X2 n=1 Tax=Hydra vulgaris TaxID=6087 RepID=UPI0032E9EDD6